MLRGGAYHVTLARSFIAEVLVTHPDLALAPTIGSVPGLAVRLESQPLSDPDSPVLFYSVSDSDYREFESALAGDHTVVDWTVTIEVTDCRIYRTRLSPRVKVLSPKITDIGVRVLAAESADRGWRLRLHSPDKESLGAFWEYCREEDVSFEIDKLYSTAAVAEHPEATIVTEQLTDRQREVARTATEMGYYDSDGASAEDIASALDISRSTLSTHLRRITAKVFDQLFADDS